MKITRWNVKCTVGDTVVATSVEAATTRKAACAKLKHKLRNHVVTNAGAIQFEASEVVQ